ncbi:MAG: hypothetical protein CM1200mP13_13600 [Candidatus Pelagibacterales bacterium]|nr:MAG: hypothetical protein CM1200mP13_13600 [Pelagibacterales bacterium]
METSSDKYKVLGDKANRTDLKLLKYFLKHNDKNLVIKFRKKTLRIRRKIENEIIKSK